MRMTKELTKKILRVAGTVILALGTSALFGQHSQPFSFGPYSSTLSPNVYSFPPVYQFSLPVSTDSLDKFLNISLPWEKRPNILPAYARQNPGGYSYLCRLELEAEEALPVPLWLRAGKINAWETYNSNTVYVQVKLWGFKP